MRTRHTPHTESTSVFRTKKSLGQHFLNNRNIPRAMARAADVVPGDVVLEIGPGTGALTRELLECGARVVAIEADARAIAVLHETYTEAIDAGTLTVIHGDARTFPVFSGESPENTGNVIDLAALGITPYAYKVVANIPYYLSGLLFRTFLETKIQPKTLVFLVQQEVGVRIAREEKESLLSLGVKAYGTPRYVQTVKRGNFTPPPAVDSAIIAVTDISRRRFDSIDEPAFFALLHAGLGTRRKQLAHALRTLHPPESVRNALTEIGVPPTTRGEDLSIDAWFSLAHALWGSAPKT